MTGAAAGNAGRGAGSVVALVLLGMTLLFPAIPQAQQSAEIGPLPLRLEGHGGPVRAITLSEDGRWALTASFDYSLILWEFDGAGAHIRRHLDGHEGAVNDVAFYDDARKAVSVGDEGAILFWDLATGRMIGRIAEAPEKLLDIRVSPDETQAVAAQWNGTASLIDLTGRSLIAVLGSHRGNVNSALFSRDGRHVFTAAYDGVIRQFEARDGRFLRPLHKHGWGVNVLSLSGDGRHLFFGALDGTLGRIDLTRPGSLAQIAKFERPVLALKQSKDGHLLAAGTGAGEIHVYAVENGLKLETMSPGFGQVWDLDFTASGRHIYHVGLDDYAILWQISPVVYRPSESEYPRRFQLSESADPGELEFLRKCSICHTLEADGKNRAGPTLYGVFGREAGTLPGYAYSQALIESKIVWNEKTIAQLFTEGPDVVTPGTKMPIQRLKSVKRRDDLIRFLKAATGPGQDRTGDKQ